MMNRKMLSIALIGFSLSLATACTNDKASNETDTDTVIVERNTTTTVKEDAQKPSTSVSVGANGASVGTNSTKVSVSKDSVTFKKH